MTTTTKRVAKAVPAPQRRGRKPEHRIRISLKPEDFDLIISLLPDDEPLRYELQATLLRAGRKTAAS